MQILLVEDDDSIREVLKLILETDQPIPETSVETTSNGAQALEAMRKGRRPDLILLDLSLADEDGFEVFRLMRAEPAAQGVPIIAVTAHAQYEVESKAIAMGFAGFVTKPIDFENALFPLIKKIVAEARAA